MTTIQREIMVSCPPSDVFTLLSHVERLPEFSEMTVAVKNGPGRPLQVGDTFDQVVKVLGIELDTEWEVTEVEMDRKIRIEGRSKSNGKASLTETIAAESGGSRVTLEVDYDAPFGLLGEIADKLLFEKGHEAAAETILKNLKKVCEK